MQQSINIYQEALRIMGNLLLIAGAYLLLFAGGLQVQMDYQRLAARGDNDLPAPRAISGVPQTGSQSPTTPAAFTLPVLSATSQQPKQSAAPLAAPASTISRVVIPSIDVDAKVIEVGWEHQPQDDGTAVLVWQVAEYAVGHHTGTANPGAGSNIVLAGHVGGYGKVFRDLFYVQPGEQVILYSNGAQYLYLVQDRLVVTEEGVPFEQRVANAQFMQPTAEEVATLITCWPPTGPDKFTQRVIIRAIPYGATQANTPRPAAHDWTIR